MRATGRQVLDVMATLGLAASVIVIGVSASTQGEPGRPDDWVKNVPSTLAGYNVLYVKTPYNTACLHHPRIVVQEPQSSGEDNMEASVPLGNPQAAVDAARASWGAPDNVDVSFVSPTATKERILAINAKWNAGWKGRRCYPAGRPEGIEDYDPLNPEYDNKMIY